MKVWGGGYIENVESSYTRDDGDYNDDNYVQLCY